MLIRLLIISTIFITVFYLYNSVNIKIAKFSNQLNIVLEKIISRTAPQNINSSKKEAEEEIESKKTQLINNISQNIDDRIEAGKDVLGIKASQSIKINNIRIDYNKKAISIPLDFIELQTSPQLKQDSLIRIYLTNLQSGKSLIAGQYITIDSEQSFPNSFSQIKPGNPLELSISSSAIIQSSLVIKPVLKINLPPGVYEGTYTGDLLVEVAP